MTSSPIFKKQACKVPLHCALVKEGVLFYFEPYVIGPSADGQYNLILRHKDIKDLLKLKL